MKLELEGDLGYGAAAWGWVGQFLEKYPYPKYSAHPLVGTCEDIISWRRTCIEEPLNLDPQKQVPRLLDLKRIYLAQFKAFQDEEDNSPFSYSLINEHQEEARKLMKETPYPIGQLFLLNKFKELNMELIYEIQAIEEGDRGIWRRTNIEECLRGGLSLRDWSIYLQLKRGDPRSEPVSALSTAFLIEKYKKMDSLIQESSVNAHGVFLLKDMEKVKEGIQVGYFTWNEIVFRAPTVQKVMREEWVLSEKLKALNRESI